MPIVQSNQFNIGSASTVVVATALMSTMSKVIKDTDGHNIVAPTSLLANKKVSEAFAQRLEHILSSNFVDEELRQTIDTLVDSSMVGVNVDNVSGVALSNSIEDRIIENNEQLLNDYSGILKVFSTR